MEEGCLGRREVLSVAGGEKGSSYGGRSGLGEKKIY